MSFQTWGRTTHRIERLQLRSSTGIVTVTLWLWLCLLCPGAAAAAEEGWVRVSDAALKSHGWRPRPCAIRGDAAGCQWRLGDGRGLPGGEPGQATLGGQDLPGHLARRRTGPLLHRRCRGGRCVAMGVDTRAPGCHAYTGNEHDTVSDSNICTGNASVEYFRMASAGSLLVYDRRTDSFQRFWYSD
ncbi:hypothetical protein AB8E26_08840 [Stenotrophomonas rhizophila]|uniref:hypothetical protein n=1 Tax=Stenotrophomonas rhizophila TaxID=216778 RepID=UPI003511BDEE